MRAPTFFFGGIDPAPSDSQRSDKGSLVISAATPRTWDPNNDKAQELSRVPGDWWFDYVYARVIGHEHKASARQWSGMIHELHERFGIEKLVMDAGAGGGGALIQRELRAKRQLIQGLERDMTPICDQVDGPRLVVRGHFILHMFKRGDPGIDAVWPGVTPGKSLAGDELLKDSLYSAMKEALDQGQAGWPASVAEWYAEHRTEVESWTEDRRWALKNLEAMTAQLGNIMVATHEDGGYVFTQRGARQFTSIGKDDLALGCMLSRAAFLIWLQAASFESQDNEDSVGFSAW